MATAVPADRAAGFKAGTFGKGLGYDTSKTSGGETLDARADIDDDEISGVSVATHEADTSAVHAASAISLLDTLGFTAQTDVEGAFTEIYRRAFREDFFDLAITGALLSTNSTGTTGNDIPFATVLNGLGGTAQVATGTDANAGAIVSAPIAFKPSTMGPIYMEARCKVVGTTTPLDGDFYIGFGDAKTYTNDLPYVLSAAGATTTGVPTEGAFIGYTSVTQTSGPVFTAFGDGTLFALTSKTGTDTVTALTASVAKDSSYHTYRVEVSAAGTATFYIDGTLRATVASAVTATVPLAPQLNIVTKASHENTLTIDYIEAGYSIRNAV